MWKPTNLGLAGRSALVAAGIAALAATSAFAFDNMSPEQRAALEAQATEVAAVEGEAGAEGGERTIFDGVYTEEQADRGMGFFGSDCAACHANTARGSSAAPGLIGYTLDNKYADQPLYDYFDYMRTNMPPGNAGWFTDQEYADIVAYLLELHGAPAGDTELEGTEEALSTITIVPTPEG
ncbi:MAG: c-type cytochrome [Pelagibacterium sp.]|uniref:c-type cytochrome n=1 Tax=Pelagibacterium sp. TaxID=1967288 RepID=UPI0032EB1D4C